MNAGLLHHALDEQDRSDGDEDVLAEEHTDVVGRCGVRANLLARGIVEIGNVAFRRTLRHRRNEWAHHLRMPAERYEAECGGDLAHCQIRQQHAPGGSALHARHHIARTLPEPGALEEADHRQHQPDDRDVPTLGERAAKCGQRAHQTESAGKPGDKAGAGDDEQRIESECEPEDDDQ